MTINLDRMRAAFAATPLCQKKWVLAEGEDKPSAMCAMSALVVYAGVQPRLVLKMIQKEWQPRQFLWLFAVPVLKAEYNLPKDIAQRIPSVFDAAPSTEEGTRAVLAMCEEYNQQLQAPKQMLWKNQFNSYFDYLMSMDQVKETVLAGPSFKDLEFYGVDEAKPVKFEAAKKMLDEFKVNFPTLSEQKLINELAGIKSEKKNFYKQLYEGSPSFDKIIW